jgi:hypothetical protein
MSLQAIYDAVVSQLEGVGVSATDDPGTFHPDPIAALVMPLQPQSRTLADWTFRLGVYVVCSRPLTRALRDELTEATIAACVALGTDNASDEGWAPNGAATDLPAYYITTTISYGG